MVRFSKLFSTFLHIFFIGYLALFALFLAGCGKRKFINEVVPNTGNKVITFAGNSFEGDLIDSNAAVKGQFFTPSGIAFDQQGVLYVIDTNNKIIKTVKSVNGNLGLYYLTNDKADMEAFGFSQPNKVVVYKDGSLLVSDASTNQIKKITNQGGTWSSVVIAGSGKLTGGDENNIINGAALTATFYQINDMYYDEAKDRLFIADTGNNLIRLLDFSTNQVSTLAGKSRNIRGFDPTKNQANDTPLSAPWGMALGADGYLYFSDSYNHLIRRIKFGSPNLVELVAGVLDPAYDQSPLKRGKAGYKDSTNPLEAEFFYPRGLVLDSDNVYIADSYNHRIRVLRLNTTTTPSSVSAVETIAGNNMADLKDNVGPNHQGLESSFHLPNYLALAAQGRLYVSDTLNHVIREITFYPPLDEKEMITTTTTTTTN